MERIAGTARAVVAAFIAWSVLGAASALAQGDTGLGEFGYSEVDYRSPLAGLELVRVNPQTMFRESLSASGRNSAINAGWIWDFEDRMPNPWEVGGKTTNYMSMGRTTVLSIDETGTSRAADNYKRGNFMRVFFEAKGLSSTLTNWETNVVKKFGTFYYNNTATKLGYGALGITSKTLRDGTVINYEYPNPMLDWCSTVVIRHVASGAALTVKRTKLMTASTAAGVVYTEYCAPTEVTLPDGVSKITYTWTMVESSPGIDSGYRILTQVTYPDGTSKKYDYQGIDTGKKTADGTTIYYPGLNKVTDEEGKTQVTYTWTGAKVTGVSYGASLQGKVNVVTNTDGSRTVTDAENVSRTVSLKKWTNAAGTLFTRFGGMSSPCAWCSTDDKDIQYNDVGLATRILTQRGVVTTITRNAATADFMQREATRVVASGTSEAKTINTSYDTRFNLPTKVIVTDGSGSSVTGEAFYNDKGHPIKERLTNTVRKLDGSVTTLTKETNITYSYHPNGQVATRTVDGPRPSAEANDVVTSTFSFHGLLLTVTDALGTTSYESYNNLGYPTKVVHPNGNVTSLSYDWAGRVLTRNTAGVVTNSPITRMAF